VSSYIGLSKSVEANVPCKPELKQCSMVLSNLIGPTTAMSGKPGDEPARPPPPRAASSLPSAIHSPTKSLTTSPLQNLGQDPTLLSYPLPPPPPSISAQNPTLTTPKATFFRTGARFPHCILFLAQPRPKDLWTSRFPATTTTEARKDTHMAGTPSIWS
jgi:hypothetical protein